MEHKKIHPALKHRNIAILYYNTYLGKSYDELTASKMFHQDLRTNRLNEKTLLKVLKQLTSEQINLLKP